MKMYSKPHIPIGIVVLSPIVVLMFSVASARPAKNRKSDTCRRPGTASAAIGMYHPSDPSDKYCRIRELF